MSDLQKHTMNFFRGDVSRLQSMYGDASTIIRTLVRRHIQRIERRAEGVMPPAPELHPEEINGDHR